MALGIFTPVALSTKMLSFDIIRGTMADRKKQVSPAAGTHLLIQVQGCQPVFYHTVEPADDAVGLAGLPIFPECEFVVPYLVSIWIYCPYESEVVYVTTGALT